ncbi:lipoate protein ligase C-terminal domain-containing protein [Bacillus sp. B15-48]|nr:hypothetical protein [Bacillus sp. B15-48]
MKYERAALEKELSDIDVKYYFGNVSKEEFLSLLY